MPLAAKPPVSFTEVRHASQARAKAQVLLDRTREHAMRIAGNPGLAALLKRSQALLEAKLRALAVDGASPLVVADVHAMLLQVRDVLGRLGPQFEGLLTENAIACAKLGAKSTTDLLGFFEARDPGSLRPLSIPDAIAASAPVLMRHRSSVDRYGRHVIGVFSRTMQDAMLVGETFDEAAERLRRDGGLLLQTRGWAERIARTEGMNALNASAHAEMLAQRESEFPDLKKKLIETFDARTAPDSYPAHGQVRELEEFFVDGEGRTYLHPPGRPNDRGVQIPWRGEWKDPTRAEPSEQPRPPVEGPGAEPEPTPQHIATPRLEHPPRPRAPDAPPTPRSTRRIRGPD